MTNPTELLARLDDIGRAVADTGRGLALIGLGSVGVEQARLDEYSDLDFFVIAQPGYKQWFLQDLSWLNAPCPIAYAFLNTADGYKALYEDGIFCELAIFEPDELTHIPFAPGRVVWQSPQVPPHVGTPQHPLPSPHRHSQEWLLGEALTNLYVGLGRYRRGEKLTAMRFVQGYALDKLLALTAEIEPEQAGFPDPFTPERRFERRFPETAALLPQFAQGYEHTPASALAILDFLERHFPLNPRLVQAIRDLA